MKKFLLATLPIIFPKKVFAGEFDILVGDVDVPKGVDLYNANPGAGNIAILLFFSKMIQAITVIAGIWVIINVILAAFYYLTGGGKSDTHSKVSGILTKSVLGLIIIISTYTIAGLIGMVFFGDPTFILNPTIPTI